MTADLLDPVLAKLADMVAERVAAKIAAQAPPPPAAPATTREWLTTRQAAEYLGYKKNTLEIKRSRGDGPPFQKPTDNSVRYRRADLDVWAAQNPRRSTSEERA
jgi:hypothetical protein